MFYSATGILPYSIVMEGGKEYEDTAAMNREMVRMISAVDEEVQEAQERIADVALPDIERFVRVPVEPLMNHQARTAFRDMLRRCQDPWPFVGIVQEGVEGRFLYLAPIMPTRARSLAAYFAVMLRDVRRQESPNGTEVWTTLGVPVEVFARVIRLIRGYLTSTGSEHRRHAYSITKTSPLKPSSSDPFLYHYTLAVKHKE